MSRGHCDRCGGPCQMPEWILNAGGPNYQNNPDRQRLAITRAHMPVTTVEERARARAFLEANPVLKELTERIRASMAGYATGH